MPTSLSFKGQVTTCTCKHTTVKRCTAVVDHMVNLKKGDNIINSILINLLLFLIFIYVFIVKSYRL